MVKRSKSAWICWREARNLGRHRKDLPQLQPHLEIPTVRLGANTIHEHEPLAFPNQFRYRRRENGERSNAKTKEKEKKKKKKKAKKKKSQIKFMNYYNILIRSPLFLFLFFLSFVIFTFWFSRCYGMGINLVLGLVGACRGVTGL